MASLLGSTALVGLLAGFMLPADAADERCTADTLAIGGTPVAARFCVPAPAPAGSVTVTATFSARGRDLQRTIVIAIVDGARTSRAIEDVDLGPLGVEHRLHMTLAFRGGRVELEHALALPGAVPVK
jgi:hypothetical protein